MQSIAKLMPHRKAHFVGIGGVGMSALAQILLAQGYTISGSDIKAGMITQRLIHQGANIHIGHRSENVGDVDILVYSSCITQANPEIIAARRRKIKIVHRAVLLSLMMRNASGIAVAGAHGKTTTTALVALILRKGAMDPSFAIGADVDVLNGNAHHGHGKYFVAEADESDGSFLCLEPDYAIITNIDKEHLDYYRNVKHIIDTYAQFIAKIEKKGTLFCYGEDKNIRRMLRTYQGKLVTYGLNGACDMYATGIHTRGLTSEFECVYKGTSLGRYRLQVPGKHNILNALAAVAIGCELSVPRKVVKDALEIFHGAHRRFQIKSRQGQVMIVDDYAHHPTEITATLAAAKACKNRRIVSVFQPHRYSRTKFLKKEFGHCFDNADHLIITDIYAASEAPIKGIEAKTIYREVKQGGHKNVYFLPRGKISEYLMDTVRDGDLLMMLGAGDIGNLADELIEKLGYKQTGNVK